MRSAFFPPLHLDLLGFKPVFQPHQLIGAVTITSAGAMARSWIFKNGKLVGAFFLGQGLDDALAHFLLDSGPVFGHLERTAFWRYQ